MIYTVLLVTALSFFTHKDTNPQKIVDRCIKAHGGKNYKKDFQFDFRDRTYTFHRHKGQFQYTRKFVEEGHQVTDLLTNEGLTRKVDGETVMLDMKKSNSYASSVNSVIYFAMLPLFLNDDAVNKTFLGSTVINAKSYYKIKVTFDAEGGGADHDDVYIYWINTDDHMIDYLAYSFHVNGGGVRFREAYNRRVVGGVTFQDYINYRHDKSTPVEQLDEHYTNNTLKELSRVELKNIISF